MSKIENYLGIANHDIQMANNSQELKSYVASILCENDELRQENQKLKKQLEEKNKPQIFIDTQDIEERYAEKLYQDFLKEENKKIKKQLEEYQLQNIDLRADIMIQKMAFPNELIKDKTFYDLYDMPSYEELLVQQKEFIKYLEDEIDRLEKTEFYIDSIQKAAIETHKHNLSKYKEIIGCK